MGRSVVSMRTRLRAASSMFMNPLFREGARAAAPRPSSYAPHSYASAKLAQQLVLWRPLVCH